MMSYQDIFRTSLNTRIQHENMIELILRFPVMAIPSIYKPHHPGLIICDPLLTFNYNMNLHKNVNSISWILGILLPKGLSTKDVRTNCVFSHLTKCDGR